MSREMTEEKRARLLANLEKGRKTRADNLARKKKEQEALKKQSTTKTKEKPTQEEKESENELSPDEDELKPMKMPKEEIIREKTFVCSCKKKYTTQKMLKRHQKTCMYFKKLDIENQEVEEELRKIARERVRRKKQAEYEALKKELCEFDDEDVSVEEEEEELGEPPEPLKLEKPKKPKKNVIIKNESPVAKASPPPPAEPREIPPPADPRQHNIVPSAKPKHQVAQQPRYSLEEYQTMAQQRQENERRRADQEAEARRVNKIRALAKNMSAGGLTY
tara:strand:- start:108 stop:938 length:831 start_codon:yes stop_codon:yes gene_type:complete